MGKLKNRTQFTGTIHDSERRRKTVSNGLAQFNEKISKVQTGYKRLLSLFYGCTIITYMMIEGERKCIEKETSEEDHRLPSKAESIRVCVIEKNGTSIPFMITGSKHSGRRYRITTPKYYGSVFLAPVEFYCLSMRGVKRAG